MASKLRSALAATFLAGIATLVVGQTCEPPSTGTYGQVIRDGTLRSAVFGPIGTGQTVVGTAIGLGLIHTGDIYDPPVQINCHVFCDGDDWDCGGYPSDCTCVDVTSGS